MTDLDDEAVLLTNDKASMTKYQAVASGYYHDPYLLHFLSAKSKRHHQKQTPEIVRGYYLRSVSIAYCVEQFILANPDGCQIISLGAGWDSLYWRLSATRSLARGFSNTHFVEIDMAQVTRHKNLMINRNVELSNILKNLLNEGDSLHSDRYHLLSHDLRQKDKSKLEAKLIEKCKFAVEMPTLCISECVLVFMPPESSDSLIHWLANLFKNATFLLYEQCNMNDRFADIMAASMRERQCDLFGIEACQSLESQTARFRSNGLKYTKAWTMTEIYHHKINPSDNCYIETLEFLDEKELLDQLLTHYCIVIASHQPLTWISDESAWSSESTCHLTSKQ